MAEFSPLGNDLFGNPVRPQTASPLRRNYLTPPFSVLSSRDGDWQERKNAWLSHGIRSEIGRTGRAYNMGMNATAENEWALEDDLGSGVSIFDPVLCELMYRWFCPPGGQIVDPFAGGSVRGIVAALLGYRYWGCDLSAAQISANKSQADTILEMTDRAEWVHGDSMLRLDDSPEADFVFSCPPYGDLERYSDDPADLSTMEWHTFTAAYRRIIMRACGKLRQDRFACFVVGDFRDGRGMYRNFIGETVSAFKEQGLHLYNEAVLITSVGTAAMRATKQFEATRKLCKVHQNVLVFIKGDPRRATRTISGG